MARALDTACCYRRLNRLAATSLSNAFRPGLMAAKARSSFSITAFGTRAAADPGTATLCLIRVLMAGVTGTFVIEHGEGVAAFTWDLNFK